MGSSSGRWDEGEENGKMEGWLYLFRSNRFGLQYSRKRYFVLDRHRSSLNCYPAAPSARTQVPLRCQKIDSCIRVNDNGRENIKGNVFFLFTLYNTSNRSNQLKLGARSSEEAAKWIRSLMEATLKECTTKEESAVACSKRWPSLSITMLTNFFEVLDLDLNVFSSMQLDQIASDVVAPSPWTIFGCNSGLRLFKEAKDGDIHGEHLADHPAMMAIGVVDATPEAVFRAIMSLGPSRSEWDYCFDHGSVIEHFDGHTDIIHMKLRCDWLPWSMKPRDLLLRRYWRREDDGTYVILYHSVLHPKCLPPRGYTRACLKSGGYVISPTNQGQNSVVKHMLAIDWRFWMPYLFTSSAISITIRMLERVAALREMFRAKLGKQTSLDVPLIEQKRNIRLSQTGDVEGDVELSVENRRIEEHIDSSQNSKTKPASMSGPFLELNDSTDEFFDFPDESESDQQENMWPSDPHLQSQNLQQPRLSTTAVLMKRLHGLAVQRRGYIDLEASLEDTTSCSYGSTLQKDVSFSVASSWATADPSTFLIRGRTYLQDHKKIAANGTLMEMVAANWLKSDKREDDLGGRPGGIVQKYAAQGGNEFFFIVNLQVPGSTKYSLALYYMMNMPVESVPLLENFVRGDDIYRNSRFKVIPNITKGAWIVKQSVGRKACLMGRALEINYFHGRNYLELGIDIGSSTVARGVMGLVLGYLNNLVIEMAFLIEGNTEEELPEFLLGTCRLNHLDASKAVSINSINSCL
ncbi:protein ENHANCED DISEASE RESISTANCE 2-like isoform X2 [Canna indica]|uniref:Protein ENHANCED DISEASE RESISTANCE 2-like isoform X2 n=1 Tax=Canna indica TaxID=4628 RepID=A0AAQ3KRD4_9LILI|nr:protein ENHANCED DISEASE RESISTANCE 2-like isoform X2 [Canna indica]